MADEQTAPSKDETLKPCPFCGQSPAVDDAETFDRYMIECVADRCVNPMTSYTTRAAAIAAWNRRASSEPTTEPQTFEEWHRQRQRETGDTCTGHYTCMERTWNAGFEAGRRSRP